MEIGGSIPENEFDQLFLTGSMALDGILDISLIDGFVPELGDSFKIFDFAGLTGEFDSINFPSLDSLAWNTSELYTTGILSVSLLGDFDLDNDVDGADFLSWQRGLGTTYDADDLADWEGGFGTRGPLLSDFDADNDVDGSDFLAWQRGFGTDYNADDLAN